METFSAIFELTYKAKNARSQQVTQSICRPVLMALDGLLGRKQIAHSQNFFPGDQQGSQPAPYPSHGWRNLPETLRPLVVTDEPEPEEPNEARGCKPLPARLAKVAFVFTFSLHSFYATDN